jgi:hypothetical protein
LQKLTILVAVLATQLFHQIHIRLTIGHIRGECTTVAHSWANHYIPLKWYFFFQ